MSMTARIQRTASTDASAVNYRKIFVPVDNSPYSNRAVDWAVKLGTSFQSTLVGCHVYAAKMHDYRFKQMEYTLPEEYLEEQELVRQRKIHDSLITMGLQLISDCYLEDMDAKCSEVGLECQRKMMDGKHSTELIRDIRESDYDLVILGALGIGRSRDSMIGSVCERVTRHCAKDIWVVKDPAENSRDTILVGIDGSPQSFGGLRAAIELAGRFRKRIEIIGVYDPYLHYAVFKGIVNVLTDRASKVFRFEEQNQLHEEIIDTGLAQIYQSHLSIAESIVREEGVEVTTTLLDGKAFQKILDHVRKTDPWLLVVGRTGIHNAETEELGSNSENLLRLATCDVLLSSRLEHPEVDLRAEESIHWTPEAEERMSRVPDMVKGIARTAILRLAMETGHSVITSSLVTEAMDRFMPTDSARTTTKLAEALAVEKARSQDVSVCSKCGVVAKVSDPVKCSVCGGSDFELLTQDVLEKIVAAEGGLEEDTSYDGRKVKWTQDARRALRAVSDKYQMRRCKARIEKKARMQRMTTITLEFATGVIGEETGETLLDSPNAEKRKKQSGKNAQKELVSSAARQAKSNPVVLSFSWTDDAVARILRVPAGFMRGKTRERVEALALERQLEVIDLSVVEDGIELGRQMMAEMIAKNDLGSLKAENYPSRLPQGVQEVKSAPTEEKECPAAIDLDDELKPAVEKIDGNGSARGALNETGWMSEMARRRKELLE